MRQKIQGCVLPHAGPGPTCGLWTSRTLCAALSSLSTKPQLFCV